MAKAMKFSLTSSKNKLVKELKIYLIRVSILLVSVFSIMKAELIWSIIFRKTYLTAPSTLSSNSFPLESQFP